MRSEHPQVFCEAKRNEFASLSQFFAIKRIRNANLDPCQDRIFLRRPAENFILTVYKEFELIETKLNDSTASADSKIEETITDYMLANKLFQVPEKYSEQIDRCERSRNKLTEERDNLQEKIETLNKIIPALKAEREQTENSLNDGFEKWMVKTQNNKETNISRADLDTKCPICMENYDQKERRRSCITVCGHQFCSFCLSQFSGSCPKCRKSFKKHETLKLF